MECPPKINLSGFIESTSSLTTSIYKSKDNSGNVLDLLWDGKSITMTL